MADASTKRTTTASLRLGPQELAEWRAAAKECGLTLSDWVRVQIGGSELRRPPPAVKADPALLAALHRIGVNLNQLAKVAHATGAEALPTLAQLAQIKAELRKISAP